MGARLLQSSSTLFWLGAQVACCSHGVRPDNLAAAYPKQKTQRGKVKDRVGKERCGQTGKQSDGGSTALGVSVGYA